MKKKFKFSPVALLVMAAILLVASTVGSTQAALTYYSENYSAQVTVSNIGVALLENDKEEPVSYQHFLETGEWDIQKGELMTKLTDGQPVVLGKSYKEELCVQNTGAIDTYVRVILTRSWQQDKDGDGVYEKDPYLSPELIKWNLQTGENGWMLDDRAEALGDAEPYREQAVLYYKNVLGEDQKTPNFMDAVSIDPLVGTKMLIEETEDANGKTIVYTYAYDGYKFVVEAEVNAVQTHNAVDAIKSAWGVDVTIAEDGSLSLN